MPVAAFADERLAGGVHLAHEDLAPTLRDPNDVVSSLIRCPSGCPRVRRIAHRTIIQRGVVPIISLPGRSRRQESIIGGRRWRQPGCGPRAATGTPRAARTDPLAGRGRVSSADSWRACRAARPKRPTGIPRLRCGRHGSGKPAPGPPGNSSAIAGGACPVATPAGPTASLRARRRLPARGPHPSAGGRIARRDRTSGWSGRAVR